MRDPYTLPPTQNDPHNLRRLRRPTGPHRAAMREMSAVEDDDLSDDPLRRWKRWSSCGVCKARFKDDVYHALAWGCWKTYTSRPERDELRLLPDGEKARDIGIPWT